MASRTKWAGIQAMTMATGKKIKRRRAKMTRT
jgi:hypothetical protein